MLKKKAAKNKSRKNYARTGKILTKTVYAYVEPANHKHAIASGKKPKYGTTSAYVNALIAADRGAKPAKGTKGQVVTKKKKARAVKKSSPKAIAKKSSARLSKKRSKVAPRKSKSTASPKKRTVRRAAAKCVTRSLRATARIPATTQASQASA